MRPLHPYAWLDRYLRRLARARAARRRALARPAESTSVSGLARVEALFGSIRSIFLNGIAIAVPAVALVLSWQQVRASAGRDVVEVLPFAVPESATKSGLGGDVVAARVAHRLGDIVAAALTRQADNRASRLEDGVSIFQLAYARDDLDVQLPGTGLSSKDLLRTFRGALSKHRHEITGEATQRNGQWILAIRIRELNAGRENHELTVTAADLGKAADVASQAITRQLNPHGLVTYHLVVETNRCATSPPCNFSAALELIADVLRHPRLPEAALSYVAWCYALGRTGDYQGAADKCRQAVHADPGNAMAHLNWGIALNHLSKFETAIEKFRSALELGRHDPAALLGWGDALWRLGRHAESLAKYREALDLAPNAKALVVMGSRLLKEGRVDEAVERLRTASRLDPWDRNVWAMLSIGYGQQGQGDKELEALRVAVEFDPSDVVKHEALGMLLVLKARNYSEASEQFLQAITLAKDRASFVSYLGLGTAQMRLNKFDEAIASFRNSTRVKPTADAYLNTARSLSALGRDVEALDQYRQASALRAKDATIHVDWADSLLTLRRYAEAIEQCDRALENKDSDNRKAAYIKRGHALVGLGKYDEGITDYQKALGIDPNDADAYHAWGDALLKLNKPSEAAEKHQRAAALRKTPDQ
jgi:tetratricopeptide (TPR) repeat protein